MDGGTTAGAVALCTTCGGRCLIRVRHFDRLSGTWRAELRPCGTCGGDGVVPGPAADDGARRVEVREARGTSP